MALFAAGFRSSPRELFRYGCREMSSSGAVMGNKRWEDLEHSVKLIRDDHGLTVSRAITLGESLLHSDRKKAAQLMSMILKQKKKENVASKSLRIGISGPPGVGKSSLIEQLGLSFIAQGHKVGVLAIDPSSNRSGGSILGDKTRMPELSIAENAYIRPSPSKGYLGGVARGTHGGIHILEAANYGRIIVETVGVGQSEIHVDSMVDLFLLLLNPGGGDELQGIKKGVVELADVIAITKSDGELLNSAKIARSEYANALTLLRPKNTFWKPKVINCSVIEKDGLEKLHEMISSFEEKAIESGSLRSKRESQAVDWMWRLIEEDLIERVRNDSSVRRQLPGVIASLKEGEMLAEDATDMILHSFLKKD